MKGIPNMGNIMKQAQKFQAKIAELQEELGDKTVEASAGGGMVSVVANGRQEIISIHIEKDEDDLTPGTKENFTLADWEKSWFAKNNNPAVFISATQNKNIEEFKNILYREVKTIHSQRFPYNDYLYDIEDQINDLS